MRTSRFRALFSDIGGVLGSNGWDSRLRARVCQHFGVEMAEVEDRHRLMFDSYERGYLTFEAYLKNVFFAHPRGFRWDEVRDFVYDASQPWPDNLNFLQEVRRLNGLTVGLISNEGEGITQHRIEKFGLRKVCDFMVISHLTRLRKPDPPIWQLALDLAAVPAADCIYIDDRPVFAEMAASLGFTGIHHADLPSTAEKLRSLGLRTPAI